MPAASRIPKWLLWSAFALHIGIATWSTRHHEAWRDEAQAWLIARDLPVTGILEQMRLEGTPALWHFLLVPLAKVGISFRAEAVLHLALGIAATGLLLLRSPFPWWFSVPVALSVFFSYEYVVVARNYGLTALLAFSLACVHPSRLRRPWLYAALIALLANTNAHSVSAATALSVWFLHDAFGGRAKARRAKWAAVLSACGLCAAAWQLGTGQANHLVGAGFQADLRAPLSAMRSAWLPGWPLVAVAPALVLMGGLAAVLWMRVRAVLWILTAALAGPLAIFAFKHSGGLRHHGLILVFCVMALWLAWPGLESVAAWRRRVVAVMACAVTAGLPAGVRAHVADARGLYSGAPAMARYLADNGLATRFIAAHPSAPASAVLPWLPGVRFWYADVRSLGTFISWDRAYAENCSLRVEEAVARAQAIPEWGPGALLLINELLDEPARHRLRLRHQVSEGIYSGVGEAMFLYECLD